jgi:hypothetical protein
MSWYKPYHIKRIAIKEFVVEKASAKKKGEAGESASPFFRGVL